MPTAVAPPWEKYAAGSEVEHFAEFCADHLVQWVDEWAGQPLILEDFQLEAFGEALAYDERGLPCWNSVIWVIPRKNAKTTGIAALSIYRLLTSDGSPEILLAAASDKQAGRMFESCAMFVRQSEALSGLLRVRDYIGEILREDGLGKILRMSNAAGTLHGYNPTQVNVDELAQWTTPMMKRAFAALTTGGGARTAPQTFSITTPGEERHRHEPILGQMLDTAFARGDVETRPGLRIARMWESKTLVYCYEAPLDEPAVGRIINREPTDDDIDAIKLANPATWITKDFLRKQALNPELAAPDFLQLHAGVWAAAREAFLPAGAWEACATGRGWPEDGTEVVLGFDGSYNNDSTALVGCTLEEKPHLFVVKAWERPEGAKSWKVPRGEVDAEFRAAMARWDVVEAACDPPGWHREIEEWTDDYGGPPVVLFETNKRGQMAHACSKMYTAVVNQELTHDGNPRLAAHMGHAVVKETPDGAYITKDGRNSPRKIDLAVAAVVAHDRALEHLGGAGPFAFFN